MPEVGAVWTTMPLLVSIQDTSDKEAADLCDQAVMQAGTCPVQSPHGTGF